MTDISNIPAEKQVLGSVLLQPNLAPKVFATVTPDEFYVPAHIQLALMLQHMHYDQELIDPTAVMTKATQQGILGKIGGGPYVFELIEHVGVPMTALMLAEDI